MTQTAAATLSAKVKIQTAMIIQPVQETIQSVEMILIALVTKADVVTILCAREISQSAKPILYAQEKNQSALLARFVRVTTVFAMITPTAQEMLLPVVTTRAAPEPIQLVALALFVPLLQMPVRIKNLNLFFLKYL